MLLPISVSLNVFGIGCNQLRWSRRNLGGRDILESRTRQSTTEEGGADDELLNKRRTVMAWKSLDDGRRALPGIVGLAGQT
jgi:hypothetical protein